MIQHFREKEKGKGNLNVKEDIKFTYTEADMDILITGSNGFIGREIARRLKGEGHLIGLGRNPRNQCQDVDEYICADLADSASLKELGKRKLEVIIHAAANLNMSSDSPQVLLDNCMGTYYLTRLAEQAGCKRFIYLSSLPVVGNPQPSSGKEGTGITEMDLPRPGTVYHVSKLTGEYLVSLLREAGIRTVSLRIPSPIGKGMSDKTILSVFLRQATSNAPITLSGKGTRRQNYVDVRDIAEAIFRVFRAERLSECYNIVSQDTISNVELAQRCIKAVGSDSEICFRGEDANDLVDWKADGSLAREELGFAPQYSLEETISWMCSGDGERK